MGQRLINLETGAVKEYTDEDGLRCSTKSSRAKGRKYFENIQKEDLFSLHNKELGGFIFTIYEIGKEFNKHDEVLTQSDLTRLVFISTYANFDGVLMETQKTVMRKKKLQELTALSRSRFQELYSKLLKLEILLEQDGRILMNEAYFFKGPIKDHDVGIADSCTRIYINTVRDLYSCTPTKSHKVLGVLFRMIPFLNIEFNIICHNPAERIADEVKPMVLGELADKLGYSCESVGKLKKELQSIKTKEGMQVVSFNTYGVFMA